MNFGKGRLKNELYNHLLTKIHIYLILLRIKKWAENDDIKLEVEVTRNGLGQHIRSPKYLTSSFS